MTLSIINLFLFNVPGSFSVVDVPYSLLEEIKDGFSISAKYDSKQLRFNTPNIIIVFANNTPIKHKVSKDRWSIFEIRDEILKHL